MANSMPLVASITSYGAKQPKECATSSKKLLGSTSRGRKRKVTDCRYLPCVPFSIFEIATCYKEQVIETCSFFLCLVELEPETAEVFAVVAVIRKTEDVAPGEDVF